MSEPIMSFKGEVRGKDAIVNVFPDRIEWTRSGGVSKGKLAAGLATGGLSLLKTGVKTATADDSESIAIVTVTGVTTEKDGFRSSKVRVRHPGGTVDFKVGNDEANRLKVAIADLIPGGAEPPQVASGPDRPVAGVTEAEGEPEVDETGDVAGLATYKVVYKGGHPDHPKSRAGEIRMVLTPEAFQLNPTLGSKKFWTPLTIPYSRVSDVAIVARQVSTFEGLAGGLDSRQLNQDNNIHIDYLDSSGNEVLLRFEMLTGVSVMGQAGKCREFQDRLRNLGIRKKFRGATPAEAPAPAAPPQVDVMDQLKKLAELRDLGVLDETEFAAKKAELLGRL